MLPQIFVATCGFTLSKQIVDKHDPMAYETIVAYRHKLTDKAVALNFAVITNDCSILNFGEWANERTAAELISSERQ